MEAEDYEQAARLSAAWKEAKTHDSLDAAMKALQVTGGEGWGGVEREGTQRGMAGEAGRRRRRRIAADSKVAWEPFTVCACSIAP